MMKSTAIIARENRGWLAGYHRDAWQLSLILAETDDEAQKASIGMAAEAGRRRRIADDKEGKA